MGPNSRTTITINGSFEIPFNFVGSGRIYPTLSVCLDVAI